MGRFVLVSYPAFAYISEHRVLSKYRLRSRGASSGAAMTTPVYSIATIRERLISRVEYFMRYEEALEAAGLSEQDAHADS